MSPFARDSVVLLWVDMSETVLQFRLVWILQILLHLSQLAVPVHGIRDPGTKPLRSRWPMFRLEALALSGDTSPSTVARPLTAVVPLTGNLTSGRWFGNFSVGNSGPLSLLVDSGSSDIVLNPGRYLPSGAPTSLDLNVNFTKTYGEYANSLEVNPQHS